MTCPCNERISYNLQALRNKSKAIQGEYSKRIDAFQEGIKSGAQELAVRHLFRAGIYWASHDNDFARTPSTDMVLEALSLHISREYPDMNSHVLSTRRMIDDQGPMDDPTIMLRTILRKRNQGTLNLLRANAAKEIQACEKALSRAEEVKKKLIVWKEGIVLRNNPEAICIVDMHDRDQVQ